jgi:hypothetical protein
MRFGGEFKIDIEGKSVKILLNITTLANAEESSGLPMSKILEGIQKEPLKAVPLLCWHGYEVACWNDDVEPEFSEKQFRAKLGSVNWQSVMESIGETLDADEDSKKKKATPKKKKAN